MNFDDTPLACGGEQYENCFLAASWCGGLSCKNCRIGLQCLTGFCYKWCGHAIEKRFGSQSGSGTPW